MKPRCNGGRWSTFAGNSTLLPSNVIDFARFPFRDFGGLQFHCSRDLEVTYESARCWEKFCSYMTIMIVIQKRIGRIYLHEILIIWKL